MILTDRGWRGAGAGAGEEQGAGAGEREREVEEAGEGAGERNSSGSARLRMRPRTRKKHSQAALQRGAHIYPLSSSTLALLEGHAGYFHLISVQPVEGIRWVILVHQ
jgi:hypothetical protein